MDLNEYTGFSEFFNEEPLLTELRKQYFDKILKKEPKKDKGLLIVFEGIDGAGKSTQVDMLKDWLDDEGYDFEHTDWNSSDLLSPATKKFKDKRELTPKLYCLLHAADLIHRYETIIHPALVLNKIVICDRYVYTSIARNK